LQKWLKMIYPLIININKENIAVCSADGKTLLDIPNIVAIDENKQVISIGETQDIVQNKLPNDWETIKSTVQFSNPFLQSNFQTELAAFVIDHVIHMAVQAQSNYLKANQKVEFELRVNIDCYEKLGDNIQSLFEYYVQQPWLYRIKTLIINDKQKPLEKIRWAERIASFGSPPIAIITMGLFLSLIPNPTDQFSSILAQDIKVFAVLIISYFWFMITLSIIGIYGGLFISMAIWRFFTKSFLSSAVSKLIIEQRKLSLPDYLMRLLWRELP